MRALRAAALRAYRQFAEQFREDYGVEPSRETEAIMQAIGVRAR
jgi:DNA-binding SARP family transcriptional activator